MKKSNLILGFYVGVIALCVATVSMSIAWYASSTQVRIEGLVMTVDCDRELAISTERDGKYVEKLEPEELQQVGLFSPVTTAHSSQWKANKSEMPVFYDETKFSTYEHASLVTVANHGYFSQKIYILADDDLYVTINPANTYINPNTEYNPIYAHQLYLEYQAGDDDALKQLSEEDIIQRLDRLVEAMRYSILINDEKDYNYAIIDPHKSEETLYGGLLDNDKDQYYDYFIKDDVNYERVYGEYNGEVIYDEASSEDSPYLSPNEEPNAFNAKHKKGVKTVNFESSAANGFEIVKEPSIKLEDFNNEVKPLRIPVYRNQPREIVLSIYIEGWDLDSINCTKGATFVSNLEFKIEREM